MASNSASADIFLILLRPTTRVPVVGEAVSEGFQGQILVESLSWKLHNDEVRKAAKKDEAAFAEEKGKSDKQGSNEIRAMDAASDDYQKQSKRLNDAFAKKMLSSDPAEARAEMKAHSAQQDALFKGHDEKMRRIRHSPDAFVPPEKKKLDKAPSSDRDKQYAEMERNRNFEFTFSKRVDIASTQMLNSMKSGDIFPGGTLTIHKRSPTFLDGTTLVFNIQKIRLLEYELEVVVTDTMTEMMEKWTCEFGSLAYAYKNPPSHYSHSNAGQAAAKTASQGTTRTFTMKNIGSPI